MKNKIILILVIVGVLAISSMVVINHKKTLKEDKINVEKIKADKEVKTSEKSVMFEPPKRKKPSEYKIGVNYNQAMKSEKPFIALFYADWCGYCVRFMPKYQEIADKYKNDYNFVMINVDTPQNDSIIEDFAPGGFPTLFIVDPKIDNRIHLSSSIFGKEDKLFTEFDRYLRIRKMIKK